LNQRRIRASRRPACGVRAPLPRDYGQIAGLATELGYPSTGAEVHARIKQMRDPENFLVSVAELPDGKVAGWLGACVFRTVEMDKCAEISGLVVGSEFRSHGIGRLLLEAAEEWASRIGCREIFVHSNVKRRRAHRFYLKTGFAWVKTQKVFRKRVRAPRHERPAILA
jgi:GNAT superfamily N-acetyltransferase